MAHQTIRGIQLPTSNSRHVSLPFLDSYSHEHPFATPLDEFVQHHRQVRQRKATNVKPKELGSMPSAELEPDLCFIGMSQPGVFDLPRDLVCGCIVSTSSFLTATRCVEGHLPIAWAASNNLANELI